jgi:hypothetical protein
MVLLPESMRSSHPAFESSRLTHFCSPVQSKAGLPAPETCDAQAKPGPFHFFPTREHFFSLRDQMKVSRDHFKTIPDGIKDMAGLHSHAPRSDKSVHGSLLNAPRSLLNAPRSFKSDSGPARTPHPRFHVHQRHVIPCSLPASEKEGVSDGEQPRCLCWCRTVVPLVCLATLRRKSHLRAEQRAGEESRSGRSAHVVQRRLPGRCGQRLSR